MVFYKNVLNTGKTNKNYKIVKLILIFKKLFKQSYLVIAGPARSLPFGLPSKTRRASLGAQKHLAKLESASLYSVQVKKHSCWPTYAQERGNTTRQVYR